jgi:hypothetical protein
MQPEGELSAKRTKENQAKILGFVWFYLVESGLFQRVTREKIKKSPRPSARASGCGTTLQTAPDSRFPPSADEEERRFR